MSHHEQENGSGFPSANLLQQWLQSYARGDYTEVVQRWLQVSAQAPRWRLTDDAALTQAVGWSLVLTKQWTLYQSFREQLVEDARHCALRDTLDAWRGINEARYDASLHAARRTRAALLDDPSHRALAHALKVESVALFRLGRYAEAEPKMEQAASLFRVLGDALHVSQCCTNLGLIRNARGDIRAAREALRESLSILETLDAAEQRMAVARENLAITEIHLGNPQVARQMLESALDVFTAIGPNSDRLATLNGLGHCARMCGDLDEAAALYEKVATEATDMPRKRGLALEFLGQVRYDAGRFEEAELCYRETHEIAANIAPDGDLMVEVCWRYAELLTAVGRLEEASEYLERAEQICEAHGDRREWGCVLRAQGRLQAAHGNIEDAETLLTRSVATLEDSGRLFEAAVTRLVVAEVSRSTSPWVDEAGRFFASISPVTDSPHVSSGSAESSHWLRRIEELRHGMGATIDDDLAEETEDWGFITRDHELRRMLQEVPTMARSDFPVLIQGESGTGKELLARAIHSASGRTGAFIAVNCAAIPESLFESEIFGHARGAFSGAQGMKAGLFEQADGGTLMLDEIGEMPLEMQAKLLRVLDDGVVRRVGELRERRIDCKVVAATNRPLSADGIDGVFRRDLFHRLSVHTMQIKPLRERPQDIAPLAQVLLTQHGLESRLDLTPELLARLKAEPWPGNVRELRNRVVRYALHPDTMTPDAILPDGSLGRGNGGNGSDAAVVAGGKPVAPRALRERASDHEREIILATLQDTDWNVASAANELDMHVTTLRRKMRRLEVQRPS